jgi:hypothetical protein
MLVKNNHTKRATYAITKAITKARTKKRWPELVNTHVCHPKRVHKWQLTPARELLLLTDTVFELTAPSLPFFISNFTYASHKWFKFIIVEYQSKPHIYVANGTRLTRHSAIYIQAMIDLIQKMDAGNNQHYVRLLEVYNDIMMHKTSKRGGQASPELDALLRSFNALIKKHFECMRVISSGSGTVFSGTPDSKTVVCLNTKSGHYRPPLENIAVARKIFKSVLPLSNPDIGVIVQRKQRNGSLRESFGKYAEMYIGTCRP